MSPKSQTVKGIYILSLPGVVSLDICNADCPQCFQWSSTGMLSVMNKTIAKFCNQIWLMGLIPCFIMTVFNLIL